MGRKWTKADVAALRTMRADSADVDTIAKTLRRSPEAVRTKMRDLGLTNRRKYVRTRVVVRRPASVTRAWQQTWDAEKRAHMLALLDARAGRDEIGEHIGVSGDSVKLAFRFNGLEAQYAEAMRARMKMNCGRPASNKVGWSEAANAKACAKLRDAVLALYRRERERAAA